MGSSEALPVRIRLSGGEEVSGLLRAPAGARACLVLAHGAGAGMEHPFLAAMARGLAERGVATLRYQFLYMERRAGRPDPPALAQSAVRGAVAEAARAAPGMVLFAGGKSFGGRMTSQAQAAEPLPGVQGLVFLGFPLHAAGKPSDERGKHLSDVAAPMLFLQGTRDELAELPRMQALAARLGPRATLHVIDDADHMFHVRKRSGRDDEQVRTEMLDTIARWMDSVMGANSERPSKR